jgi:hypothetical protein
MRQGNSAQEVIVTGTRQRSVKAVDSPLDAGSHSCNNSSACINFAAKVVGGLRNGFRAPTVAEGYYTKSSTSPTSTGVSLAPNSPVAALFGLGNLQPETSTNYSLGVVFDPVPQFTSTLDAYQIELNDRVVNSGTLYYLLNGRVVSSLVGQAIALNGNQLNPTLTTVSTNLFVNGVDTRTRTAFDVAPSPFHGARSPPDGRGVRTSQVASTEAHVRLRRDQDGLCVAPCARLGFRRVRIELSE